MPKRVGRSSISVSGWARPGLEGEAVDERLQRRARRAHGARHVDGAEAVLVEIARRADVRDHLAGAVVDGDQRGGQASAQRVAACSRTSCSRFACAARVDASGDARGASCSARPRRRPGAGRASGTRGARSACARPWRASASSRGITPCAAACGQHAVARALARPRGSDPAGAARATAAGRPAGPLPPATAAAAPCRNRRARRRARPRGCRRTARAAGRGAGSRPWRACARAASARSAWRSLPAPVRSCSPSSRRATCMVSVEPPETMRPVADELPAGAPERAGVDAVVATGSACPRRPSAWRDSAGRHPWPRPAAASGRRAWCRRAAGGRCGRAR